MEKIQDAFKVWDNDVLSPFDPIAEDIVIWLNDFFARTGAKKTVATQWIYRGKKYRDNNCPIPVPDYSGLVYPIDNFKKWIVLNPNGSMRFTITVPIISSASIPEKGYLGVPLHWREEPSYIMHGEGSDGDRDDCRFFFNMHTGQLETVELVGRHW